MATNTEALRRAIKAVGTQTEFAKALAEQSGRSCTQKSISKWVNNDHVPLHWLIYIERVSGVPCHELDPEYYPAPQKVA